MRAELHAIRGWMWRDRELFERVADENKIAEDFRIDPPVRIPRLDCVTQARELVVVNGTGSAIS